MQTFRRIHRKHVWALFLARDDFTCATAPILFEKSLVRRFRHRYTKIFRGWHFRSMVEYVFMFVLDFLTWGNQAKDISSWDVGPNIYEERIRNRNRYFGIS